MAGGNYRGGSTIIYTGNPKKDVPSSSALKAKKKLERAPGLHVLSKEDSKAVMKKVWASRRKSERIAEQKEAIESQKKAQAFSRFVRDVRKLEGK